MSPKLSAIFSWTNIKPWILAGLSGLLMSACFAPIDFGAIAFFALVPLFYAIKGQKLKSAFRLGHFAGWIFFAITYDWMTVFAYGKFGGMGVALAIFLAWIMALFTGVLAVVAAATLASDKLPNWFKPAVIASAAIVLDYVRQLGSVGLGWGDLGYSQWNDPIVMLVAPLMGIWGLTWIVITLNVMMTIANDAKLIGQWSGVILGLCILGFIGRLPCHPIGQPYVAAALQANIDQDVAWEGRRPQDPSVYINTMTTFAQLANQAAAKGAKLCVTAETAMPGYLDTDIDLQNRLYAMAKTNNLAILAGGRVTDPSTGMDKNVMQLFTADISTANQSYAKEQLVPFGEFVPFQKEVGWLSVLRLANFNMESGSLSQPPLDAGGVVGKVGVSVCYDSAYPRCVRSQVLGDAGILAVGSDDTWYGHTSEGRQSLAIAAVRAAESDRYLVRCSATGISAIIDSNGRIIAEQPLFTQGALTAQVQPMDGVTLFVKFGDWWVGFCAVILVGTVAWARHKTQLFIANPDRS